jgi:hypothetical protein
VYKITRKNRIREQLQLCNEDDSVALEVPVDLNVDEIQGRALKAMQELGRCQAEIRRDPKSEDALEAFGNAVITLFTVIFGEDGAKQIIAFYEDNYTEMIVDVFPFITGEILPKIAAASEARKEQMMQTARAAKQMKRRGVFGR